jgi:drug/metabolite transporter (DMT)-like permease
LSAPILAAVGGVILVDEALTLNLLLASFMILGGIWLVLRFGKR